MAEIDLTQLPQPKAIEELDFETIFTRKKTQLINLCPESIRAAIAATLELESEPLTIDLQQQAYQELLLRQRINQAVAANLLALATDSDLDHLAAIRGLSRKTLRQADPTANPPVEAEYESDSEFRRRIQAHPEKYAAAGPRSAYVAHAIDAHNEVSHAQAVRPKAGQVDVYIKTSSNNGIATADIINTVQNYLSDELRRPLCDTVRVLAASPKNITVSYTVEYEDGPDKALVAQKQAADLATLWAEHQDLGANIALSKIIGALDTVGVKKIVLQSPTADIQCNAGEFINISSVNATEVRT